MKCKRIKQRIAWIMLSLLLPVVSLQAAQEATIDTTAIAKGVVHVSYKGTGDKQVKVMIQKGADKYTYNLNAQGEQESFPLQLGNGDYKISVLENTTGSKYRLVTSEVRVLDMPNPNDVYLNTIQNINWSTEMQAILKAQSLTEGVQDTMIKEQAIYAHLVGEYFYDYDKLATLAHTYIPVIDETYVAKTGICYDFSSLYASMLRSQGIPVKLVKGYTPNAEGYHAWNEVYDVQTDTWSIIDTTYDLQMRRIKETLNPIKSQAMYQKVKEY